MNAGDYELARASYYELTQDTEKMLMSLGTTLVMNVCCMSARLSRKRRRKRWRYAARALDQAFFKKVADVLSVLPDLESQFSFFLTEMVHSSIFLGLSGGCQELFRVQSRICSTGRCIVCSGCSSRVSCQAFCYSRFLASQR